MPHGTDGNCWPATAARNCENQLETLRYAQHVLRLAENRRTIKAMNLVPKVTTITVVVVAAVVVVVVLVTEAVADVFSSSTTTSTTTSCRLHCITLN